MRVEKSRLFTNGVLLLLNREKNLEERGIKMDGNIEIFREKIMDAEMVLIGIGEEFQESEEAWKEEFEQNKLVLLSDQKSEFAWVKPFVKKTCKRNNRKESCIQAYDVLYDLVKEKNYFIVTTSIDDGIWETQFQKDKIVAPCGGYRDLQCSQGCNHQLTAVEEYPGLNIEACMRGEVEPHVLKEPVCTICGSGLVFNNIEASSYIEEGYLEQWNRYKSWLQGTVNKKVCVLELGVGMKYPTVIRWPFEKIVFFNQKASFFRVNSKLYHLSEEIKDRSYKIKQKPIDFLINRFV